MTILMLRNILTILDTSMNLKSKATDEYISNLIGRALQNQNFKLSGISMLQSVRETPTLDERIQDTIEELIGSLGAKLGIQVHLR